MIYPPLEHLSYTSLTGPSVIDHVWTTITSGNLIDVASRSPFTSRDYLLLCGNGSQNFFYDIVNW